MKTTKRLFIGFPIVIESSLHAAIKRTKINAQQKGMEINWVPEANFHVTLNFLGDTEPNRLDDLRHVIESVSAQTPPLKTSLRGLGAFPDERHMRVLWVGVRKSRALAELQWNLDDALKAKAFPSEERDYVPHLTIARLRKARSGTDLLSPYVRSAFGDVAINTLHLYESVHHGAHPVYEIMNKFKLSGTAVEDAAAVDGSEPSDPS